MSAPSLIRIFVAEDEAPIRKNIINKINRISDDFEVVGTADNGEDALLQIQRLHPDILFTDIRMPIMDGLQLCEQVRAWDTSVHMVIISGYDDFEYARTSIKLGVVDYLLKPVKTEQLEQLLCLLQEKIHTRKYSQERDIFSSQLLAVNNSKQLPSSFADYSFMVYLICFGNLITHSYQEHEENDWFGPGEADLIMEHSVKVSDRWWVIDDHVSNQKIGIIGTKSTDISVIATIGERLLKNLSMHLSKRVFGVTICAFPHLIPYSKIKEAAKVLRKQIYQSVVPGYSCFLMETRGEIEPELSKLPAFLDTPLYKEFSIFSKTENFIAFTNALEKMIQNWEANQYPQYLAEKILIQLLHITESIFEVPGEEGQEYEQMVYRIFQTAASYTAMYAECSLLFQTLFQKYTQKKSDITLVLEELKDYLNRNYADPITMDELSAKFNFNGAYLIRVFKKHTGESPMRYLLRIRMETAIDLLQNKPELSIKEISELVGYDDQHYFSRLFKKYTLKTPSDYRTLPIA